MRTLLLILFVFSLVGCGEGKGLFGNRDRDNDQDRFGRQDWPVSSSAVSRYGVIAYSRSTGASSVAYFYGRLADVRRSAESGCSASDCRGVLWVEASCGALAVSTGDRSVGGYAISSNRYDAIRLALGFCRQRAASCALVSFVCS